MRIIAPFNILAAAVGAVVNEVFVHFHASAIEPHEHNPQQVEKLAIIGCTDDDIADRYLVPVELIRTLYPHQLRRGRALHRIGIRQAQWSQTVKQPLVTMLIWLGRNVLGQTNDPERPAEAAPCLESKVG
ncbi:MAG TPA: hypothetical protein VLI90_04895 [Tepidisphaeraceae bacterium]|nr:hypothetical protein [Tepidisphaeraceae bacterium]